MLLPTVLLICCVASAMGNFHHKGFKWCYNSKSCGPAVWHKYFSFCGGMNQSPVNLVDKTAIEDKKTLSPFKFLNFDQQKGVKFVLRNTGHSVQVDVKVSPAAKGSYQFKGADLPATYQLLQFHFHFGSNDHQGSEHTRNGRAAPMEMHLVAFDTQFGNVHKAFSEANGLVVIGVFFRIGKRHNPYFDVLANNVKFIKKPGQHREIKGVHLLKLLPKDTSHYFRYSGSLTTPTCNEVVDWTVLDHTIEISEAQMKKFRAGLVTGENKPLANNFRPVQKLNGRHIYKNF